MAAVESNYNASEMLTEVNNAIYAVLVGGQSYKIGTRQLTRADLSLLYKLRNFNGAAPTKDDLVEAERMSQAEFNEMMEQWQRDNDRKRF